MQLVFHESFTTDTPKRVTKRNIFQLRTKVNHFSQSSQTSDMLQCRALPNMQHCLELQWLAGQGENVSAELRPSGSDSSNVIPERSCIRKSVSIQVAKLGLE